LLPFMAASLVHAHGQIYEVIAGGVTNHGPDIYWAADSVNNKTVTRVMYQASSPSYVLYTGFTNNSEMSCEGSSAASAAAPDVLSVAAGSNITVQWAGATSELLGKPGTGGVTDRNPWVHAMGMVVDYITSCGDSGCTSFDATNAGWTKVDEFGIDPNQTISDDLRTTMSEKPEEYYPSANGLWGMAKLVQDGSQWDVTIPSNLKAGEYILRHEIGAMHNPKTSGDTTTGPQLYISCIQLEVTGDGTVELPDGTQSGSLYDPDGDFANFDVYSSDTAALSFVVPGPAVWDGASSSSSSSNSTKSAASN
ncbi:hypothetical protein FISHEDRAFT_24835, partial [Fistulina hepatica ATCC 64428]